MVTRVLVAIVVALGLLLVVSQFLPPNSGGPRSIIVPALALVLLGGLAGWTGGSIPWWVATITWVVLAAVLVLLGWTDLLLDVAPSAQSVDAWRGAAFAGIVAAVAIVSVGFALGAVIRKRRLPTPAGWPTVLVVVAVTAGCVAGAWLTASAFSGTDLVIQDDARLVTVIVSDAGIEVRPAVITGVDHIVVYESTGSQPWTVASILPNDTADGTRRAMAGAEIAAWTDGDWRALSPAFPSAVSAVTIAPGERLYGGRLDVVPGPPDGAGGVLWYSAEPQALRAWPPGPDDAPPDPAPWPIRDHVVVPVVGG